jgi:hypothetical protein
MEFFYNRNTGALVARKSSESRSMGNMARKNEGAPRKSSSRKTEVKQSNPVTPIRENNGAVVESGGTQLHPGVEDEIRQRAYELYQERGGQHGFDQEDWSRAEAEILSKYQREREKSA